MLSRTAIRLIMTLTMSLVVCSALLAAPRADQAFATAKQLYQARLDQQAIEELQAFVRQYPTDGRVLDALLMQGRCQLRLQQYDQALAAFKQVITKATPNRTALLAEAHFQSGDCYLAQKNYEAAAASYKKCLATKQNDADLLARAQYWMAESLYQLGRLADAVPEYQKVATQSPRHALAPWALYSIGMVEVRRARYAQAVTALERVTTGYKESEVASEAMLMLGFAQANWGRSLVDPASAANREDHLQQATTAFTAVLDNANSTASAKQQAQQALAQAYFDLKAYGKAEAAYAEALRSLPITSRPALELQLARGHALFNAERYAEAATAYTQVVDGKNTALAIQGLYWLGNSQYQQAQKSKDAQAYQSTIATLRRFQTAAGDKHPQAPNAALLIAYCYEDLAGTGDLDARPKALDAFKAILVKWPTSREAKQAQMGIARMTMVLTPDELKKMVGIPEGAATWSISLRLARDDFQAGKYDSALTGAKKLLDSKPVGDLLGQASYLTGATLHKLTRVDEAIPFYKQALAAVPAGELAVFAQRGLTQAYLDKHRGADAAEAAKALERLARTDNEKVEALMYLAEAQLGDQHPDDARQTYEKIITQYPAADMALHAQMGIAWVAESRKAREQAIAAYRALILKYPDDKDIVPQALFHLGLNLAETKAYTEAIDAFAAVPTDHPIADQAAYAIAWVYVDQEKLTEANTQFAKVAEQFPKSPLAADSLYRIGEYWLGKKNYTEAVRYFARSFDAASGPLAPLVAYKLAVCAFYTEQYPVASNAFGKVAANYPTHELAADSLFWKAQAQEKQGQFPQAREVYLQYVAKYPDGALALDAGLGAGRVALSGKQYAIARADLLKVVTRCEEIPATVPDALKERAQSVAPEAQFYLGQSYYEEKNYSEALKLYAVIPAVYAYEPWYSRALLQMARCSALTNNLAATKVNLQRLLNECPLSDAAKDAPALAREYKIELRGDKEK